MVTVEDVNGAVKTALDAVGAALPGGGWSGSGPDEPTYPYAMFSCRVRDTVYSSGPLMTQWWRVTVRAYHPVGQEGGPTPAAILQGVVGATCLPTSPLYTATFRNATDKVLHALPADTDDEPSPVPLNGRDVLVLTTGVELMVQSDRSVA